jgi:hypothetical protein
MIVKNIGTDLWFVFIIINSLSILAQKRLKTILTNVIFKYLINRFKTQKLMI